MARLEFDLKLRIVIAHNKTTQIFCAVVSHTQITAKLKQQKCMIKFYEGGKGNFDCESIFVQFQASS